MSAEADDAAHLPKTPHVPQPARPTFEAALAELGELVGRLESGTLGLSDSIAAYEKGVSLLRGLHEQLAEVEERVRMLVRVDDEGRPVLETPAPGSVGAEKRSADEKPRRTSSRGSRPKQLPGMDDAEGPL